MQGSSVPLNKVAFIAYNASKKMIATYSEQNGQVIISNTNNPPTALAVNDTYQTGANQILWCGDSGVVLTIGEKLALVGPNDHYMLDVKSRSDCLYCTTEEDGLRVLSAENTYFLEILEDATIQTFGLA